MPGPRKEGQPEHFDIPTALPEINGVLNFQQLEERIRNIKLLNDSIKDLQPYRSSQISLEEVKIKDLVPCARYVLNQNLEIQKVLRAKFIQMGIDTLHLTEDKSLISFSWGDQQGILTPPVVEISEDDGFARVITDGLHRVEIGKEANEETVTAIVIRNTAVPLAVLPVDWSEVKHVVSVPPANEKRKMRFEPSAEMFKWFGLNERNLERLIGGFANFDTYSYKALFRDFSFGAIPQTKYSEPEPYIGYDHSGKEALFTLTKEESLRRYSSAGFLVTTSDSRYVLLGTHHEASDLWGNFAGGRDLGETDPKITAARELKEELGIEVNPNSDLGEPLIVINNTDRNRPPKVGIIYQLKISDGKQIKVPADSEIKEVRWWNHAEVMDLMDVDTDIPVHHALWGGVYTSEALKEYSWINWGHKEQFGGIAEIYYGHLGLTQYEKIKQKEKNSPQGLV